MIPAASPAPMSGPIIGTSAYPQSELPLSLIGKTACATRGPKSRAGLIAYPVGPPRLRPMTQTRTPQNHGLNPGARPPGPSSLLPKLKPTTIKQMVTIVTICLIVVGFSFGSKGLGPGGLAPGFSPWFWGVLVWVIGLSLGGPTGYAINPARDLGPRVAHAVLPISDKGSSDWGYALVPIIGPLIGAGLAAGIIKLVGIS